MHLLKELYVSINENRNNLIFNVSKHLESESHQVKVFITSKIDEI